MFKQHKPTFHNSVIVAGMIVLAILGYWKDQLIRLAEVFWNSVYCTTMACVAAVAVAGWCFDRAVSFNSNYNSPLYTKLGFAAFGLMLGFGWHLLSLVFHEKRNAPIPETDG